MRVEDLDQQLDDEALARALQEEFSREYSSQRHAQRAPSHSNARPRRSSSDNNILVPGMPVSEQPTRRAVSRHNSSSNTMVHGTSARRTSSSVRQNMPATTTQAAASIPTATIARSTKVKSLRERPPPLTLAAANAEPMPQQQQQRISNHKPLMQTPAETDEEFARRLEKTFREEERALRRSPSNAARRGNEQSHATNKPPSSNVQTDEEYSKRLEQSLFRSARVANTNEPSNSRSNSSKPIDLNADVALARELQRAMDEEDVARRLKQQSKRSSTPLTSRSNSETSATEQNKTDYDLARQLEQELLDEHLARELAKAEQQRVNQRQQQQRHASAEPPRTCSCKRVLSLIVPTFLLSAVAAGILWYFLGNKGGNKFFPSPEDFKKEDPFTAQNPNQANRWRSDGSGLALEVVRATEESWYDFFYHAVDQWDQGTPDALTLSTSATDYDFSCTPLNYKLKVCNGDYGDTRWKGINKVLLMDGYIFASAARMNEYYLKGTDDDQKTYTMCHEVGHGFGLPHSDENFYNADLGNCMDYTNNPSVNMQPDVTNFEFLAQLYGTVPGSATLPPETSSPFGNRRSLSTTTIKSNDTIPEWIMDKWRLMENDMELHSHGSEARNGWRLLHENEFGESHELNIGQGYSIRVEKLLAH
ncbi:hypothetical protein MPSEU_000962300 [Mayamaea pseudoterrestris]|nr:hypothetical protein MPSEU_000962300 [Mayamaea pseudoterrestris]